MLRFNALSYFRSSPPSSLPRLSHLVSTPCQPHFPLLVPHSDYSTRPAPFPSKSKIPISSLPIYTVDPDRTFLPPSKRPVPPPRGAIQDVVSFLHAIGRGSTSFADKITSWDMLFTSSSETLKKLGLTPKQRKYLLVWTEYYRQGKELCEIMAGRWPKRNKRTATHKKQRGPKK